MISNIPEWAQIFLFSMFPWVEARYTIPYAMIQLEWMWWQAFPLAVLGNFLPIPFILVFFHRVEKFLRNYSFWCKLMDWLFARTRRKADRHISKYQYVGLFIFVAIPIPFTGAWTGALIAYLFQLNNIKSLITIFCGIVLASLCMIVMTVYIRSLLIYFGVNI
ncbi:MAG: small multi-drug export protein [Candidatus Thermoplasmatota archaeon]